MYQFDSSRPLDAMSAVQTKSTVRSHDEVVVLPLQPITNYTAETQVSTAEKLPTDLEKDATKLSDDQQLGQLISNLLKYGVLIASTIVLLGGILYLIHHGAEPADYQFFHGAASEFRSPTKVFTAVSSGSRRGIIQLGLLVLIATPITRVAVSLLAFIKLRDFTYIAITLLVLAGLIYSVIGAYF